MIDFANIAFRTVMSLAFLAFVVRPLLMSMVRKEPNTLELEEMAQLAVNSAFKEKFAGFQHTFSPNEALFSDPFGLKSRVELRKGFSSRGCFNV